MKAFIFDFDGVIVDSERAWQTIGNTLFFPSLVTTWTTKDGERTMGLSTKATHALLTKEYGLTLDYEEYLLQKRAFSQNQLMKSIQPLPGLLGLIERLHALHIPIGIGSSAGLQWIQNMLAMLKLEKHFPLICSAEDVGDRTKPAPDIYLLVAEKLQIPPVDCVVLEDTYYGVTAAKAAGMTCIAIRSDINAAQDLSAADKIVTHYDTLTTDVLEAL